MFKNYPNTEMPLNSSNINKIIESGSYGNGTWVKYIDGTMECWNEMQINDVSITSTDAGSGFYRSTSINFPNFPQQFISKPNVIKDGTISYESLKYAWIIDNAEATATNPGGVVAISPSSS